MPRNRIDEELRDCDVFLDLGTPGTLHEETVRIPKRVLLDGEPGFRQITFELALARGEALPDYDLYYTVGMNIGTPASTAPTAGIEWHHVFDPAVVDLFPAHPAPPGAPFTTVMSWQAHKPIEFRGTVYGQKDLEFAKFIDLPSRLNTPLELAIAGPQTPVDELKKWRWRLLDSHQVTLTFDSWCDYIANSRGEFSVAKNVFVATNSGFFSDRSAAYLASGRPVVMQETGFSAHLPCGRGLFAVCNVEEAADAIRQIEADYETHSRAAREIAMEHLEASRVLPRILAEIGL
jgi:hypothetical protein